MGKTPSAAGPSVPACPTRLCLSSLRMRATTSCEVMPVGLLILKIPSIYLSFQLCYNHRYCLYKRHMQRRTGCPLMTATSEMHADGSSIIRSRTAQAQPCQIRLSIAFEEGSN